VGIHLNLSSCQLSSAVRQVSFARFIVSMVARSTIMKNGIIFVHMRSPHMYNYIQQFPNS